MKNTKPEILHLTLKKEWFAMIVSGEKKEEYRELKDYWKKRFWLEGTTKCRSYDIVRFKNGYAKDAPEFDIVCKKITMRLSKAKWSTQKPTKCFVIELGEILSKKNIE
ncbi:MAG: ASCH domain-containing protein [Bacteroidetes bacterium]|nr:ASCH domain-containing protein [Bacteroidota bacterium]